MLRTAVLAAALTLAAAGAHAQSVAKIRGSITSIEGTNFHVMASDGPDYAVTLSPGTSVTSILSAKLSEVKPGSYIGVAAETRADGTLVAKEVSIFPEAMRGAGEGHRGFDLGPQSTMTNGTVGNEVKGTSGNTLTLAYKGGEKTIFVPPEAPIVTFAPGDKAMLIKGAHVIVQTKAGDGGVLTAERVSVGKDGLVPPM